MLQYLTSKYTSNLQLIVIWAYEIDYVFNVYWRFLYFTRV